MSKWTQYRVQVEHLVRVPLELRGITLRNNPQPKFESLFDAQCLYGSQARSA